MQTRTENTSRLQSSFRDPSGVVFLHENSIYRQINNSYKKQYDHLIESGLYKELTGRGMLVPHTEVSSPVYEPDLCYKIIKPERLPFISYPYEWCYSELRDAALLTLEAQKKALEFGMILKDANAYNVQFYKGRPVLIDTLSFEDYSEGRQWVAYSQFCRHFLAPLMLMHYCDARFCKLFAVFYDGIPLDLASSLLPLKTYLSIPLLVHIHMQAKSSKKNNQYAEKAKNFAVGRHQLLAVLDSLESTIKKHAYRVKNSAWADYYSTFNYSEKAFNYKKLAVGRFLDEIKPRVLWDFGANDGTFSRLAAEKNIFSIAFDIDHESVEKNYRQCVLDNETKVLPLLVDLTNPSPGIGWNNAERLSFAERRNADTVLALAVIHHLAITHNIPFEDIAGTFARLCSSLIIEFVPKSDPQSQRLLATREDIFDGYTKESFEKVFSGYFNIVKSTAIEDSQRTLYLMTVKK